MFTMFDVYKMIEDIEQKGVCDRRVLEAMKNIPRHKFVPFDVKLKSYEDSALPIGESQTISQPYIVAYMTSALNLNQKDKVLEVGTGSGYQTAVLARLCLRVCTIELKENLANKAKNILDKLQVKNVNFFVGDGFAGLSKEAPFDAITVTAAPPYFPPQLFAQLKEGGRMIIPVGPSIELGSKNDDTFQWLYLVKKIDGQFCPQKLIAVRFVPMVSGFGTQTNQN